MDLSSFLVISLLQNVDVNATGLLLENNRFSVSLVLFGTFFVIRMSYSTSAQNVDKFDRHSRVIIVRVWSTRDSVAKESHNVIYFENNKECRKNA